MSLKEESDRLISQEQQAKATAEKTADYYRKLCAEVPGWDLRSGPVNTYKDTLPMEAPPEIHALLQEFIEACPDSAWVALPVKAERANASCMWRNLTLEARYEDPNGILEYYSKYRLSDGSIHVVCRNRVRAFKVLGEEYKLVKPGLLGLLKGGKTAQEQQLVEQGRETILREAQAMIDKFHTPALHGSQEAIQLLLDRYRPLILFRDGALFQPDKSGYSAVTCREDEFRSLLLDKLMYLKRSQAGLC